MANEDTPYSERGGGAYVRLKDGRTVPEDSPEGQAALGIADEKESTSAADTEADAGANADGGSGDGERAKPATSRKVK